MINPAVSLVLMVTLFGLMDGTGDAGFCWSGCLPTDGVLLTRMEVSGSMAGEGGGFKSTTNFKRAKSDCKVILIGKCVIFYSKPTFFCYTGDRLFPGVPIFLVPGC